MGTDGGWPDKPQGRFQLSAPEEELIEELGVRVVPTASETVPFQVQKIRKVDEDEKGNWYGASGVKPATQLEHDLYQALLKTKSHLAHQSAEQ